MILGIITTSSHGYWGPRTGWDAIQRVVQGGWLIEKTLPCVIRLYGLYVHSKSFLIDRISLIFISMRLNGSSGVISYYELLTSTGNLKKEQV